MCTFITRYGLESVRFVMCLPQDLMLGLLIYFINSSVVDTYLFTRGCVSGLVRWILDLIRYPELNWDRSGSQDTTGTHGDWCVDSSG